MEYRRYQGSNGAELTVSTTNYRVEELGRDLWVKPLYSSREGLSLLICKMESIVPPFKQ